MASSFSLRPFHPLFTFFLLLGGQTADSCYTSIFNFGDSISDTGNLLFSSGDDCPSGHPPYGETFFGHPTGRFSNGRIIIDFLAEAMGLPFLPPFLRVTEGGGGGDFRQGVNFAIGGATAQSNDFFRKKGLDVTWTNMSLGVQVGLFKELLDTCKSGCEDLLNKSLIICEIGGNDYNRAFFQTYPLPVTKSFVLGVINAITMAIDDLINIGAKTLLVPGNFPMGCFAAYLTAFENSEAEYYEANTGCIKWLNELSEYHNNYLKKELDRLSSIHPHVTIIYGDYFNTVLNFINPANSTSLKRISLAACCSSGGGRYNYDGDITCGSKNSSVCDDPSSYLCWDGMHLTEAAYKAIVKELLEGPFVDPSLNKACSSSNIDVVMKGRTFDVSKVD